MTVRTEHEMGRSSTGEDDAGAEWVTAAPALASTPVTLPLSALVEAVLFVADTPVAVADLARALDAGKPALERALVDLATACDTRRGVRLQRTNGHVQLVSAPEGAAAIERFFGLESSTRLSRAALDALSIIAYRQPVTRPEIDALRGVDSEGVLRTLLARGLVEVLGRRDTVGHPVEYGTTFLFLEYFGLTGLDDLPPVGVRAEGSCAGDVPMLLDPDDLGACTPAPAPALPGTLAPGARAGGV